MGLAYFSMLTQDSKFKQGAVAAKGLETAATTINPVLGKMVGSYFNNPERITQLGGAVEQLDKLLFPPNPQDNRYLPQYLRRE